MNKSKTLKKFNISVIIILLLSVCLLVTTYALTWSTVTVLYNVFQTGKVEIDLNGGKAIIGDNNLLFEPGMTISREFYIENHSTGDVYYKLYFDNISGDLASVLDISIKYGDELLYQGTMSNLTRDNVEAANNVLEINEKKTMVLVFYYPPDKGNEAMNQDLSFDFCADAVQTKNNPDKLFT